MSSGTSVPSPGSRCALTGGGLLCVACANLVPMEPSPRPPLDADRLPAGVEILSEAPSTNAALAERARAGALEGAVVVAEHQTAGRGRLDRTWETPARSALTFSVLLRPNLSASSWPWIPLLVGYAVQAALADRLPAIALKWPNDVLVEERKLGGILVERVDTPTGPAAVVGIGINVVPDPGRAAGRAGHLAGPRAAAGTRPHRRAGPAAGLRSTACCRCWRTPSRSGRRTPTRARRSAATCGSTCRRGSR